MNIRRLFSVLGLGLCLTFSRKAAADSRTAPEVTYLLGLHDTYKANKFTNKFGVAENPSGWVEGAILRAYIDIYLKSQDVTVLTKLNELLTIVADGNDENTSFTDQVRGKAMPGWGNTYGGSFGGKRYTDYANAGRFMYAMAAFARIVKTTPSLHTQFNTDADRYLGQIARIFLANLPWLRTETYSDGSVGEYFVYPDGYVFNNSNQAGQPVALNEVLIPAEALAEAHLAIPNPAYKEHVQRAANYFAKHTWEATVGGAPVLYWSYRPSMAGAQIEDNSHGAADLLFVKTAYEAGLVGGLPNSGTSWNATMLQKLANTFTNPLMNGSYGMNLNIDGSGGAITGEDLYHCSDWVALRPYDNNQSTTMDIYYACKQILDHNNLPLSMKIWTYASFYRYNPAR